MLKQTEDYGASGFKTFEEAFEKADNLKKDMSNRGLSMTRFDISREWTWDDDGAEETKGYSFSVAGERKNG